MSFDIFVPTESSYIRVKVKEDITKPLAMEYTRAASDLGKNHQINRLLVDARGFSSKSQVIDKYDFAHEAVEKLGINRSWKVVILNDRNDEEMKLFETIMRNVGYNYRTLDCEETAINWLQDR